MACNICQELFLLEPSTCGHQMVCMLCRADILEYGCPDCKNPSQIIANELTLTEIQAEYSRVLEVQQLVEADFNVIKGQD